MDWDRFNLGGAFIDPQPELASLAFARDGSMILGFRDRFMDVLYLQGRAHRWLAWTWARQGDHQQALRHATRALTLYRSPASRYRKRLR